MVLSIGIVALNEEKFLPELLLDITAQRYPHECIEVLLVDSGSIDTTHMIMNEFKADNPDFYNVQILDNPKKSQAAGWNVAIENFKGDVLARIDAHARLTPEYSLNVMKNIEAGEKVVGGVRHTIAEHNDAWNSVVLQVENSLFGSSINSSRRDETKRYVKTMFHAAYCREVFEKVGKFSEVLLRTEDNEFHYRIRRAGYKLCYDPTIISYQYIRGNFRKMFIQKYQNGLWIGKTLKVCPNCLSIYHLIPCAFLFAIIITSALAMMEMPTWAILTWKLYGIFAITSTVISGFQSGFHIAHLIMPGMFLLLHLGYGIGTLVGFLSCK